MMRMGVLKAVKLEYLFLYFYPIELVVVLESKSVPFFETLLHSTWGWSAKVS